MIPRPLAIAIIVIVTMVWTVTLTAPLWRPGVDPAHPAIHAVFMVIVGSALTMQRGAAGARAADTMARILGALRAPTPDLPPPVEPSPPPAESEPPP